MNPRTIKAVDLLLRISAFCIVFGSTLIFLRVTEPVQEAPKEVIRVRTLPKLIPDIEAGIKKPEVYSAEFEEELEMSALFYAVEPIGRYEFRECSHLDNFFRCFLNRFRNSQEDQCGTEDDAKG